MDIIAFCCDYTRYDSVAEFNAEMGEHCDTLEDVQELTVVIPIGHDDMASTDKPFIVANY